MSIIIIIKIQTINESKIFHICILNLIPKLNESKKTTGKLTIFCFNIFSIFYVDFGTNIGYPNTR